jgi:hypothetical protein
MRRAVTTEYVVFRKGCSELSRDVDLCLNDAADCTGVREMFAGSFDERRADATSALALSSVAAASDAGRRPAAHNLWRDWSRDGCRWSLAERSVAVALTVLPLVAILWSMGHFHGATML